MEREFSAEAVRNLVFAKPPIGKRGYHQDEVDAFLDAIEDQLRARRLTPCPEPEEDEQASVPDDRIAGAAPDALGVRDPGLPLEHQPAVVRRAGSRVRFV